jgi:iron(III) transport system substrate-binding protein
MSGGGAVGRGRERVEPLRPYSAEWGNGGNDGKGGSTTEIMRRLVALLFLFSLGCGDGRTVLTVYSPHAKDLLEFYEKGFEEQNPDVDVQWVDMGSQEILDRVRAEKANPQADVWFGAPAEGFSKAAREGLLEVYRPTWADLVTEDARGANDLWYGTYLTPEVIAYNREAVSAEEAPKDWDDVLDPKWKNRILIRDPVASGSMRAIFGGIIARSVAETGSPEAGFEWLRRLDGNTKEYALNPTMLYQKLGRQDGVLTLYNMPDIATLEERTRIPVTYVIPSSGTPMLVDGIAIVKGTKQPEIARRYYEFVTSREAILAASERFKRIPARSDIPADALPAWIGEALSKIRPMPGDHQMVSDSLDSWMTYWDSHIRNSRRGR